VRTFIADFETTTNEKNCHVWAWALCEVGELENVYVGTDIYDFMDMCEQLQGNLRVYFHNLKFDGQFIISWLFQNDYKLVTKSRDRASQTFKTMISDEGLYYAIEVVFYKKGKNIKKVTFYDSMKLLPMSVERIAESFRLPIKKGRIDYEAHNDLPYGSPLTKEEMEYIIHDVQIVGHAIGYFQDQGLDRITIGSCALSEYKKIIGQRAFDRLFPVLNHHDDIKQSYRGGFTYVNPKFAGKTLGNGVVLDVNSLFPWVMRTKLLPHGTPIFFRGKYQPDELYPLYTQMFTCEFDLKPGKIPTIQDRRFGSTYITSSNDEQMTLCLNSIDLELFLENYEIYNPVWHNGWKFMGSTGLFDKFIDKWSEAKIQARKEENWGLYMIAKLFLNSLYGKFGTSRTRRSKIPYMDGNVVAYKDTEPEQTEGVYVAMASFITSYAREKTIRAAQKICDDYEAGRSKIQFCYADTDSLHCISEDFSIPEGLYVDKYELGAWKFESRFNRAKFLRAKCYIENSTEKVDDPEAEYKLKVTVAGMPEECHDQVTFSNFKIGAQYSGKKSPKIVPGGVVLQNVDFTIKR
jgi:hypothetical protein